MFGDSDQEFARIEKPWWKKPWIIVPLVSTILMLLFKDRMGSFDMSTAVFLWITGNAVVILGVSAWEYFKYHSHQIITTNLHGSYNPEAVHEIGDYWMATIGSFVSDVGAPRSGDYTLIVPKNLMRDWGNNKIILGTPTPARIEELPIEVREFIIGVPYYKEPFLYTEVPANPKSDQITVDLEETKVDTSRLTSMFKAHNSTITTLHKLLGALERGAISVTDFATSAKRMLERPGLLERVIGKERGKEGERQHAD